MKRPRAPKRCRKPNPKPDPKPDSHDDILVDAEQLLDAASSLPNLRTLAQVLDEQARALDTCDDEEQLYDIIETAVSAIRGVTASLMQWDQLGAKTAALQLRSTVSTLRDVMLGPSVDESRRPH
jgi:hypothetical protein